MVAVVIRNRRDVETAAGPAGVAAPGRHHLDLEKWAQHRELYLDNLKVILIAMIIAIHGVLGYVGLTSSGPMPMCRRSRSIQ
jgi:hypothetical protein